VTEDTLVLPSLSPIGDKPISALIDDRCTSANGGLLLFQEVERRLNLADRLAACLHDPRQPGKITHPLDEILRFRMLAIVAGYPDGNDCDVLRGDPVFKMALDRPPVSGPALCSQPTVSRIENMPRRTELYRMAKAMLDRMAKAMLDLYCDSFPIVPSHLTLDLDESFDRVHGEQELRKFNAYYDDWGFLPIHIFDTSGRLVLSVLREAATPSGREILALVKRVVGHLRERFPRVRIRLRGDSHYACPEVMNWCEAHGLEYIFGLAGTAALAAQVQTLEARTGARYAARSNRPGLSFAATSISRAGPSPGKASAGSSPGSKPDPTGSTPAISSRT
jgi:Transposase DDE domain group 1